jgi:hypothetical protein
MHVLGDVGQMVEVAERAHDVRRVVLSERANGPLERPQAPAVLVAAVADGVEPDSLDEIEDLRTCLLTNCIAEHTPEVSDVLPQGEVNVLFLCRPYVHARPFSERGGTLGGILLRSRVIEGERSFSLARARGPFHHLRTEMQQFPRFPPPKAGSTKGTERPSTGRPNYSTPPDASSSLFSTGNHPAVGDPLEATRRADRGARIANDMKRALFFAVVLVFIGIILYQFVSFTTR